ncbi:MAG: FGGY-family carbohydrate kinase [Gammaproteobacteria bacterium]|nr:FGGY-family carbohydrate kinase [Gammaproteobacteria bacterium]MCW8987592.1 FGGY-family carbohydrate kinase [Gammaproteobacteria bacterium]MCW9030330.1 FGGY-family carbohydrate kinase [Gammaproteobacteria bacterium]
MTNKSYSSILARPSSLFIGVDLGTSGCRAIAINASGDIKAHAKVDYFQNKDQGQQKQTPANWWHATQSVLKDIISQVKLQHIEAISIDGTSGTVMLCDDSGQLLTPALMYNDTRAKAQALFLKQHAPKDSVVLSPSSGLAKVLWLLEHYPQENNFHIVHQADWIAGLLTQRFDVSDINNTLKTGFDPINKIWPLWLTDLLHQAKINKSCLPRVQLPATNIAIIHPHIASELGLPIDVDIVSGTTDSTAAFIASGAQNVGDAVTSLGSTLVLKVISDTPINKPAYGIYSQPYDNHWLVGGASNSGGAVLRYYFNDEQMKLLSHKLKPNKPTNLKYYPLINKGERFPINNPELEPKLSPKVDDDVIFFQALLEGIADIEHAGYKLLEQLGAPYPTTVKTTGGGVINKAWSQIRENKLGVPVVDSLHSSAAYGSALLAAKNNP